MLRKRYLRRTSRAFTGRLSEVLFPVAVAVFFSICVEAGPKHQPWVDKDWTQWSSTDCENVLKYSPWAYYMDEGGRETGPSVYVSDWVLIQLRSALPIRQALLRQVQLQKHYDKMDSQKRQAFDQEHAEDLAEGDKGQVVIRETHGGQDDLPRGSRDDLRDSNPMRQQALLLSNGALMMPLEITVSGLTMSNTAEYVFPRMMNGKPLYAPTEKAVSIVLGAVLPYHEKRERLGPLNPSEFKPLVIPGRPSTPLEFPIPTLMYKGKLEY
jgi:hypothetical protein